LRHPLPENRRSDHDVTELLQAWSGGEISARDRLMAVVYEELRHRAAARLRRERPGHVLQPTALVNEAYLRLAGQQDVNWQNRAHFFGVASEMMRRILVDHARRRKMAKRSGGWARITLDDAVAQWRLPDVDVLDLDTALTELGSFDQRKSRVAELRFFGGLTPDEIALPLGISRATVDRDWQAARAWLYRRITDTGRHH
jgi:RNA polymerase sigma factor (TIGR02999 family)